MANALYFSMFSGEIYEASPEEEKTLDAFQLPLKSRPKSCNKCKGYFYLYYNLTDKHYVVCPKCMKKHLDIEKILNRKNEKR